MTKIPKKKTLRELVESLADFAYGNSQRVDARLDTIVKRLDIQGDDITDIKRKVTQLVQSQASRDHFEIDTDHRLTKIEKHLKFI